MTCQWINKWTKNLFKKFKMKNIVIIFKKDIKIVFADAGEDVISLFKQYNRY